MLKNFIIFLVLALAFAGFFGAFKNEAATNHKLQIEKIPSVRQFGASPAIENTVSKFGMATGAVLGLLAMILSFVIYLILKIVKVPVALSAGISNLVAYLGVAVLGFELAYLEERRSVLASAITNYVGKPLFYAGLLAVILAVVFLVINFIKKVDTAKTTNVAAMALVLILPFVLSGCSLLGDLTSIACNFETDGKSKAHCYQQVAQDKDDERVCDKAPQGDEFKTVGSNPPKDKCYYMVATNKGDTEVCNNIKGGAMSYSASDCKNTVIENKEKDIATKLSTSNGGKDLSEQEKMNLQANLEKLNKMYEMMSSINKNMHETNMAITRNLR